MRLGTLFSGGKDSTYAAYAAQRLGHSIECLLTIRPQSDESHLLHFPNIELTRLQAKSMKIPLLYFESDSGTANELLVLEQLLAAAKDSYNIEGVVHGGILSEFQRRNFEQACASQNLSIVSPIWKTDQHSYMRDLLNSDFEFILTSVTADGLDGSWLGRTITPDNLKQLEAATEKYSFNVSFEGGEAETFVTDCPLFSSSISITKSQSFWDGYRGRFEILEAKLQNHA